jgi:hypothetical protein
MSGYPLRKNDQYGYFSLISDRLWAKLSSVSIVATLSNGNELTPEAVSLKLRSVRLGIASTLMIVASEFPNDAPPWWRSLRGRD